MLESIYTIVTFLVAYMCMLFIVEYVFLELKLKYRKWYILGSFVTILITYFVLGEDFVTGLLCAEIGLYVALSRKKKKLSGVFICIPAMGICDGIFVPVLNVAQIIFSFNARDKALFGIGFYLIIIGAFVILQKKSTTWQKIFEQEKVHRSLVPWERNLLYMIGVLLCFSSIQLGGGNVTANLEPLLVFYIATNSAIMFVLTITVIVIVMQGNKKVYYHQQVSQMQYNIITTMADIIESRDENTGGHIRRTARYVEIIAYKLKEQKKYADILTDSYINDMIIAAPLHDMGKIHVSDMVLNKPGRLTEEEFEAMKSHTTAGKDMLMRAEKNLGDSSYLKIAVEMAEYHHEWWNGKGYPRGISGQEIPLCARIMAVADVFDALISKRCYKEAMPLEKAYGIIKEESGTHFDPEIVNAFFDAIDEIEAEIKINTIT